MRTCKTLGLVVVSLALLCAGVSCGKDGLKGKRIKFGARSDSATTATRTSYSYEQYTDGVSRYERIDWEEGDLINIHMDNGKGFEGQDYAISGVSSSSSRYSQAGLVPHGSESGLMWGTGSHIFWAAYPNTATFAGSGEYSISGTIPAAQTQTYSHTSDNVTYYEPDMASAYMIGSLALTEPQEYISLDFHPAITTLDFLVGANEDMVVSGFSLSTANASDLAAGVRALYGNFTATFDSSDIASDGSMACSFSTLSAAGGHTVTTSFSPAASISGTKKMRFKIFCLPQDIQGLRVTFNTNKGNYSLNLKYTEAYTTAQSLPSSWVSFPARVKAEISGLLVPGEVWYITFSGPRVEQWEVHDTIVVGLE